jgi:hypothetical protein
LGVNLLIFGVVEWSRTADLLIQIGFLVSSSVRSFLKSASSPITI